jgi:signal transduction histidine kinase
LLNKKSNLLIKLIIKIILGITIFAIIIAVSFGSNYLVQQVTNREKASLETYANIYKHYITGTDIESALFFLEVITPTLYFPMIITDANDEPIQDYESYTLNIFELEKIHSIEEQHKYLVKQINEMKQTYSPIIVPDDDGEIIAKFYYSHSKLVDYLRFFPLLSVIAVIVFVIIGYFAFNAARNNEQSSVWVGMAKETAHQLGTPISSLFAWIELLRLNKQFPEVIEDTAFEIENDINRLNIIAMRFSKIGSKPDMKIINISQKIDEVCNYYEKRLPHLAGKVTINRDYSKEIFIKANDMLMIWVFENLIKNAVEAMEGKNGELTISTDFSSNSKKKKTSNKIQFLVKDTGKGMNTKLKLQIFEPGFTTKKRGWGIGLNLVKRIIEEYHNGKIYVKESSLGKGTTFAIELPIEDE